MQYAARFQAVVDLLESVWNSDVSEDVAVRGYMKTHRYIGGGDRKEISRIFWDIARKTGRFRALNESLTPRMAVIAFLFYDGKHADEIKAVFSGEKYAPFPLSSDENAFLNALPEKMPDILFEAPEFLRNVIGKEILEALSKPALLDLRVNTLKSSRSVVLKMLQDDGIQAQETPFSPVGIRVFNRPDLRRHELVLNGFSDIQDEGSQLVSLLCGAKAGDTVVDWCAGAGGKTLALSVMMENQGRIDAIDFYAHRMKDLPERVRRAGCENVRVLENYPTKPENYDLVFVDAPCSGTGTWRRSPFLKWRTTPETIQNVVGLQMQILNNAAPFVKKGGRLFYVTCSVLDAENDRQVERFLTSHKEFELCDLSADFYALTGKKSAKETVSLRPDVFQTDGFFAAAFVKK